MSAVILAAGQGTRLRPLTDDRPKCMVAPRGVPLLHRQLAALAAEGVDDVTVVTGYAASALVAPGARTVHNERFAETNMVASLMCVRDLLLAGGDVLVSYGDIVCEPRVIAAVLGAPGDVAVAVDSNWRPYWELRFADPLEDAESLRVRADGSIAELGQRPGAVEEIEGQFIGLLKLAAGATADIVAAYDRLARRDPAGADAMYMTDFIQALIDEGWMVQAVPISSGWLEIDEPSDVALFESGRLDGFYEDAVGRAPGTYVGARRTPRTREGTTC